MRLVAAVVAATLIGVAAACGSGGGAVYLSSGTGEVCAQGGDGQIGFSGSGLEPGSEVTLDSGVIDPMMLTVDGEGRLDPNGMVGFLTFVAGAEVTFTVTATDDRGAPIVGTITTST